MVTRAELLAVVKARNDADQVLREVRSKLNEIDTAATNASQSLGTKFGGALTNIATTAGGFLVAQGLMKAPALFTGATSAASDLNESVNAVNQIFGENAQEILDWGDKSANSFGLAQRAFNEMAVPLGAMLNNAGIDMGEVTDTTIALTERAADMASVFNTDVDAALAAIQAGLRGQGDPLEKYGVSLSAAAVEQKALAMSGKEMASELTDEEKALARVELIMEQTAAVAGDFAATSGDAANKTRILAAKQEELAAKIGQKLLPVQLFLTEAQLKFTEVLANQVIPAMVMIADTVIPPLSTALRFLSDHSFEVGAVFAGVAAGITAILIPSLLAAIPVIWAKVAAWTAAAVAMVAANAPMLLMAAAIAALVVGVILLIRHWDDITEKFPILGEATDAVRAALESFAGWITGTFIPAAMQIGLAVIAAGQAAIGWFSDNWDTIMTVVRPVIDQVVAYIRLVYDTVNDVVSLIRALIDGDWDAAWQAAQEIVNNFVTYFKETLNNALAFVQALAPLMLEAGTAAAQAFWDGHVAVFELMLGWARQVPGWIVDAVQALVPRLGAMGSDAIRGMWQGAIGFWSDFLEPWFRSIPDKIEAAIGDLGNMLYGAGKSMIDGLARGIVDGIPGLNSILGAIPGAPQIDLHLPGMGGPLDIVDPFGARNYLPGFADGGQVAAGRPIVVGERGPEVFVPGASGEIVPNGRLGGITVNVYASGYIQSADGLVRDIDRALKRAGAGGLV